MGAAETADSAGVGHGGGKHVTGAWMIGVLGSQQIGDCF
jgi:hypothetical protein